MTLCIGSMGDGWHAELYFEDREACIVSRHRGTTIGPIATVPIGAFTPETDEEDAKLDKDDPQNQRLVQILAAPKMLEALRYCQPILEARANRPVASEADLLVWRKDMEMLRAIEGAIVWASTVPQ